MPFGISGHASAKPPSTSPIQLAMLERHQRPTCLQNIAYARLYALLLSRQRRHKLRFAPHLTRRLVMPFIRFTQDNGGVIHIPYDNVANVAERGGNYLVYPRVQTGAVLSFSITKDEDKETVLAYLAQ